MIKILYLYFYKGSSIKLSLTKYSLDKIYIFSKNVDLNKINKKYDLIIFGGGKTSIPTASDVVKYVPELYDLIHRYNNTKILGICYGMEILYHFYYNKKLQKLNKRNVNVCDISLDQRYKESQLIGNYLCNVHFNHKYYCGDINKGIISYILYDDSALDDDKEVLVKIPSFVKFNKNHYGIQFHNNNYKLNDCMIFSIL